MTTLRFTGVVDFWSDEEVYRPWIGGVNVLEAINAASFGRQAVTVGLMDARYVGELFSDMGSPGWSEYTPGGPAELTAGNHNVFDRLVDLSGQVVTLFVSDEPIDLGSDEYDDTQNRPALG